MLSAAIVAAIKIPVAPTHRGKFVRVAPSRETLSAPTSVISAITYSRDEVTNKAKSLIEALVTLK